MNGKRANRKRPTAWCRAAIAVLAAVLCGFVTISADQALTATPKAKPYDRKFLRLSEIIGAVHYLRELCGAQDGQRWRKHMTTLLNAEGTSALRRAQLAQRFNRGYRSYSRTYRNCTPSAKSTITRFLGEAVKLTDDLLRLAR